MSAAETDVTPIKRWIEKQASAKTFYSEFQQERQLRSLKKPIVNDGKFWFEAPGSFRWELGSPAKTIAVQRSKQDLLILEPVKKTGKRYTVAAIQEEGKARGMEFLEAGFPRTFEDFEKNFKVQTVELNPAKGYYEAEVSIRDRKTSVALRKMVFHIDAKSYELRGFHLRFRDSSTITTTFTKSKPNANIPSGTFNVDVSGYKLDEK
jgi:outer membrane lipoprotein-sorting protein